MKLNSLMTFCCAILLFFVVAGCATPGASTSTGGSISIGMSKEEVAQIVGRGNVNLAKKRTRTTSSGVAEVWILWKGPFGWSWADGGFASPVTIEFQDGAVSAISE